MESPFGIADSEWREFALCRHIPWEDRAPYQDTLGVPVEQVRQAQRLCYGCPVQVECLTDAVEIKADFGIWGGLTESQRKRHLLPKVRRYGLSILQEVIVACGERSKLAS